MNHSVLSLEEIRWVWALYYVAAIGLWILFAWVLNYKRFQGLSLGLLALSAGVLFTPWFIVDSKPDMAPAFMILLFDLFSNSGQSVIRLLIPMVFVVLVALLVLICGAGVWRWRATPQQR